MRIILTVNPIFSIRRTEFPKRVKINLWKGEAARTGETAQRSGAEKGWRGKMRTPDEEKWGTIQADRLLIARVS